MFCFFRPHISACNRMLFEGLNDRVPHRVCDDETATFQVLDLKKLPDHGDLEQGADTSGHHDKNATRAKTRELMKSREEISVPIRPAKEIVRRLEPIIDAFDANAPRPNTWIPLPTFHGPLACCFHDSGAAAGDDVDTSFRERTSERTRFLVLGTARFYPGASEDNGPETIWGR